jgi:hypothetical protein
VLLGDFGYWGFVSLTQDLHPLLFRKSGLLRDSSAFPQELFSEVSAGPIIA